MVATVYAAGGALHFFWAGGFFVLRPPPPSILSAFSILHSRGKPRLAQVNLHLNCCGFAAATALATRFRFIPILFSMPLRAASGSWVSVKSHLWWLHHGSISQSQCGWQHPSWHSVFRHSFFYGAGIFSRP